MDSARHADHLFRNFIGSPTVPSGCYRLCDQINIACSGLKKRGEKLHLAHMFNFHVRVLGTC